MRQVEIRNQKRIEEIREIRALLLPGDLVKIQEKSGRSYRAVHDTLNEKHTLFSKAVIDASWQYLIEQGRIKAKEDVQPTATH